VVHVAKLLMNWPTPKANPTGRRHFSSPPPKSGNLFFSDTEVAHELSRAALLDDTENHHYSQRLPEKDEPEQPIEAPPVNRLVRLRAPPQQPLVNYRKSVQPTFRRRLP
jgi:hypothetical protein